MANQTKKIGIAAALLLLIGTNVFTFIKYDYARRELVQQRQANEGWERICNSQREEAQRKEKLNAELAGSEEALITSVGAMPDSMFKANLLCCVAFHLTEDDGELDRTLRPLTIAKRDELIQELRGFQPSTNVNEGTNTISNRRSTL